MRPDDILDAIGNVDDIYVKRAKEKKKSYKRVWVTMGSLAACLAVVILSVGIRGFMLGGDGTISTEDRFGYPLKENLEIYYVEGEELLCEQENIFCTPEDIFEAWKQKNGIGQEVILIAYQEENNDSVLTLVVSENIKDYYDAIDSKLLMESLEETLKACLPAYDEWRITFD